MPFFSAPSRLWFSPIHKTKLFIHLHFTRHTGQYRTFFPNFRCSNSNSLTISLAIPRPWYWGRTATLQIITFLPFGLWRLISVKSSSLNDSSSVQRAFMKPTIFPVSRSIATKNDRAAYWMRSFIIGNVHASLGGKQIASIPVASSASSGQTWRN